MNELHITQEPVSSRSEHVKIERVSLLLLLLWCLLPVAMSIFDMVMEASGRLFPGETLMESAERYSFGSNSLMHLRIYRSAYWVIGILTLTFAALGIALSLWNLRKRENIRKYPWFYCLLLLLIWAVISSVASDNSLRALLGEFVMTDGLFSYFMYAGVFVCASFIRKESTRRKLLLCYCGMVSCLALIMVAQESGNLFLRACMPSRRAAVFNQFNHFGYVLCMGILAFYGLYLYDGKAGKGLKCVYLLGFTFLSYALLMNDTFGAYLATVAALPVACVFHLRRGDRLNLARLLPALLFVLLSLLSWRALLPGANSLSVNLAQFKTDLWNVAIQSENAGRAGTGRYELWRDTLKRIVQRPVFGFGPEGFYGENAIHNGDSTHNEYLQMGGFLGIPGLVLYLSALITLAVRQWKHLKKLDPLVVAVSGVTVVYLFSACFGNPVFNHGYFVE